MLFLTVISAPVFAKTPQLKKELTSSPTAYKNLSKEEMAALIEEIPANRMGTPREVATLVLQLIDSPKYLTGQIITMDGGFL